MSSTNRGAERDELDRYYTPANLARACVRVLADGFYEHLSWRQHRWAWEPHVGGGAFVEALRDEGFGGAFVSDKDAGAKGLSFQEQKNLQDDPAKSPFYVRSLGQHDFVGGEQKGPDDFKSRWNQVGLIIGNPPYKGAEAHVEAAMNFLSARHRHVTGGWDEASRASSLDWQVGFLLPLSFLASAKRRPLFKRYPVTEVWVTPERPDFSGGGGDSVDYGFFIWSRREMEQRRANPAKAARLGVLGKWEYTEAELERKKLVRARKKAAGRKAADDSVLCDAGDARPDRIELLSTCEGCSGWDFAPARSFAGVYRPEP